MNHLGINVALTAEMAKFLMRSYFHYEKVMLDLTIDRNSRKFMPA